MKKNKFILRVIIGLTTFALLAIVYWIFRLNYDKDMRNNDVEQKGNNSIYEINRLIPGGENKQINSSNVVSTNQTLSMEDINYEDNSEEYKKEIMALIGKGIQIYPKVDAFLYLEDFGHEICKYEEGYEGLLKIIKFERFNGKEYKFSKLEDTDNYIYGIFRKKNENTYVVVNKTDGVIKLYSNETTRFMIY